MQAIHIRIPFVVAFNVLEGKAAIKKRNSSYTIEDHVLKTIISMCSNTYGKDWITVVADERPS
jgi:hypothetical protein